MADNHKLLQLKNAKNEEELTLVEGNVKKSVKTVENNSDTHSLFIMENNKQTSAAPTELIGDEFEHEIAKSMQQLEQFGNDSDSDFDDADGTTTNLHADVDLNRNRTVSAESSGSSDADDNLIDTLKKAPKLNLITDLMPYQPLALPLNFIPGRRLSECKEEPDEEDDLDEQTNSKKLKSDSTKTSNIPKIVLETPSSPSSPTSKNHPKITEVAGPTRRFIVTKASPIAVRKEVKLLQNMTPKQNSQTIHFPCSNPKSVQLQSLFSQNSGRISPHVDRSFFDTSLVEIRPLTSSVKSINDLTAPEQDNNVWVKRDDVKKVNNVTAKKVDVSDYNDRYSISNVTATNLF